MLPLIPLIVHFQFDNGSFVNFSSMDQSTSKASTGTTNSNSMKPISVMNSMSQGGGNNFNEIQHNSSNNSSNNNNNNGMGHPNLNLSSHQQQQQLQSSSLQTPNTPTSIPEIVFTGRILLFWIGLWK